MAKFYIQSGDKEVIVSAADAQGAALWLVNRTIRCCQSHDNDCSEREFSLDDETFLNAIFAMDQLNEEILVSEIGFGQSEAGSFETEWLFEQWCGLMDAMSHLFDQLNAGVDRADFGF